MQHLFLLFDLFLYGWPKSWYNQSHAKPPLRQIRVNSINGRNLHESFRFTQN